MNMNNDDTAGTTEEAKRIMAEINNTLVCANICNKTACTYIYLPLDQRKSIRNL